MRKLKNLFKDQMHGMSKPKPRHITFAFIMGCWFPDFKCSSKKTSWREKFSKFFLRKKISKVDLLDNMDYELLNARILDLNDSTQRSKIFTHLGYKYLLGFRQLHPNILNNF